MWTISVCQDKHYHHRFPSKNNGQSTVVENYCLYLFILSLQPTSLIDDFSLPNMNMNMNKFSGTRTWRRTNFALFRTTIRSSHPMFFGLRARCSDQDEFVPFKELFPAPSIPFQSYPKRVPARRVIKIRGRFGLTETGRVFNVTISDPFFFVYKKVRLTEIPMEIWRKHRNGSHEVPLRIQICLLRNGLSLHSYSFRMGLEPLIPILESGLDS